MTQFSSTKTTGSVVPASRSAVWDVLTDPDLLAEMTPFLKRITADGEHWRWEMNSLDVLGKKLAPTFTERMVFKDQQRIEFHHEPPVGVTEWAGVEGWYDLRDGKGGTHLEISLEITLDLPLPRLSGPAVRASMKGVTATMGDRFAKNLLTQLGV